VVFQRGPEPADYCLLGFGQPGPVERQVPAQVPAGGRGAGKGPVGPAARPSTRTIVCRREKLPGGVIVLP
jgi:hypothetical protein